MTQTMPPGFPPNPYAPQPGATPMPPAQPPPANAWAPPSQFQAAPAGPPGPQPPTQYAGHTGATPMQAPVPQPAQPYTGLGPSGYGAPPGPAQGYAMPAPAYPQQPQPAAAPAGYVPPVAWDDPAIYAYQNQTPFVPFVPNDYTFGLLHLRYEAGKYYATVKCLTAAHQQPITDGSTGMPLAPCTIGGEYCLYFDFTKTGKQQWMTKRAQSNLQAMIGACTREAMNPALIQQRLAEFMAKSRDELSALGFRFRLVMTPDPGNDGKVYTKSTYSVAQ